MSFLNKDAHKRRNLLTGEWILVSPHRMNRPWQGQVEKKDDETKFYYYLNSLKYKKSNFII